MQCSTLLEKVVCYLCGSAIVTLFFWTSPSDGRKQYFRATGKKKTAVLPIVLI